VTLGQTGATGPPGPSGAGDVPATPNTNLLRDPYGNGYVNNMFQSTLIVVTTGGTTNFPNNASLQNQILLQGTLGQTLKFPNAASAGFAVGTEFRINNNTTGGIITLKDNANTTFATVPAGGFGVVYLESVGGGGVWECHALIPHGSTWGLNALLTSCQISTTSPTNSTSPTTGSLITSGGAGILKDLFVGGNLNVAGTVSSAGAINNATIWFDQCTLSIGTSLTWSSSVTMWYNTIQYQSPFAAPGAYFTFPFNLSPGTFTLFIMGGTNASGGIITWSIDGVSVGTTDTYAAGSTGRTIWSTVVTVPSGTSHILRGSMLTKNGSSGGYASVLNKMWLLYPLSLFLFLGAGLCCISCSPGCPCGPGTNH